jgi:hypothetical protein
MKFMLFIAFATALAFKAPDNALSPALQKELLYLYEEEKVARDVYDHFGSLYGIKPFVHISASEQYHFETLEALVISQGIITEDEVIRNEAGIFMNEELQSLFDDFTARGEASLIEALKVSAYIEEHDIAGLMEITAATNSEQVRETLNYLVEASKNHLRAFNRNLANRDVVYEPVLLEADFFNDIISADTGCCQSGKSYNAACGGKGKGCCKGGNNSSGSKAGQMQRKGR